MLGNQTAPADENLRENVLAVPMAPQALETLAGQGVRATPPGGASRTSTYCVIDEDVEPGTESKPKKAQQKRKTPGKRGPKGSKCLEWRQVKQVAEFAHQARTERRPLNVFVTVRAPKDMSDAEGKRIISRSIGHLGEKLRRNGQEHVGVTVYEKGPHLHAHHLAHIAPKNLKLVLDLNEGEDGDVHVRKADWFAPVYATKQRKWMGPEIEDKIATKQGRRPWEKGIHIVGPRLSFTKEAKAIVARRAGLAVVASATAAQPEPIVHPPVVPTNSLPVVAEIPEQLPLFEVLPERHYLQPSDLRSFRQVRGYTQAEVSQWAGIRNRSHIANFERGHDRLSPHRQRLLKHMMGTRGMAA